MLLVIQLFVCESVADAFRKYTGICDNVCVAYNTLDTDSIIEQSKEEIDKDIDGDVVNFVSVGRLGKEKGYYRLLDVFYELKNEEYKFRLYLIGTGSEESNLKRKTEELDLVIDVIFLGYQENPHKYVSRCDVFICSSYTEGLSTATIEALILGKAIISTDVSGAREILGDSEYGLVVENTKEGIYTGVKQFLSDGNKLCEFKSHSNRRRDFFNIDNTVKKIDGIIYSLINN